MPRSTHRQRYDVFLTQLREARLAAQLTQGDVAQQLGATQTFVSKCERGERRLDVVDLIDFLRVFKVSSPQFVAALDEKLQALQKPVRPSPVRTKRK
jgi:transcriptional regulator with XRE-family HTH domain